jgi:hypothetical protein
MNMFSFIWSKISGLFKEANLKPLDPVPVEVEVPIEEAPSEEVPDPPKVKAFKKQLTKNFHIDEFACHDGTAVPEELYDNVLELAENLQKLRDVYGKPIKIVSGYRPPEYNKKIGGARKSKHMSAMAADIRIKGVSPKALANKIAKLIEDGAMKKGGLGRYPTFTHYDVRGTNARWSGSRKKN